MNLTRTKHVSKNIAICFIQQTFVKQYRLPVTQNLYMYEVDDKPT